MRADVGGHFRGRFEQLWKCAAVSGDDRIVIVEHVKIDRSGVSIDRHLYAVSNVVDASSIVVIVPGIRKLVGGYVTIDDPYQATGVIDHDVRIGIVCEKGCDAVDAGVDIPVQKYATLVCDVV